MAVEQLFAQYASLVQERQETSPVGHAAASRVASTALASWWSSAAGAAIAGGEAELPHDIVRRAKAPMPARRSTMNAGSCAREVSNAIPGAPHRRALLAVPPTAPRVSFVAPRSSGFVT